MEQFPSGSTIIIGERKIETIMCMLEDTHLQIIDSLIPFYGTTRGEVIKNLVIRWIEQNIGSESIKALRKAGAVQ